MKHYGMPDADTSVVETLRAHLAGVFTEAAMSGRDLHALYILHHPRKPLTARMCQWPGSLLVQAVLSDGRIIDAIQYTPNGAISIKER